MLGKVVAARIALKELEAQCRLECRYLTTDGCMVGPSAASGQRDGTRPGNGEEEAEVVPVEGRRGHMRSEEHTSELQSLMRISYAVFCLKKKHTSSHIITNDNKSINVQTTYKH